MTWIKAQWRRWTVTYLFVEIQVPSLLSAGDVQALEPRKLFKETPADVVRSANHGWVNKVSRSN